MNKEKREKEKIVEKGVAKGVTKKELRGGCCVSLNEGTSGGH